MQRRIDRALRQIKRAAAARLQVLQDHVPMRGPIGDRRKDERVELSAQSIVPHTSAL
jgi:hypothetical protein